MAAVRFQSAIVALALGTHLLLRNEGKMMPCSPADWTAAEAASAFFTGVNRNAEQPLPLFVTLRLQLPHVTRGGSLKQCYILFMHTNVSLCSWVLAHKHTCTNLLMACPTPWMLRQLLYLQQQAELSSRYHPDGCGGWELLGNGVLMSCRLRMTLGALRMVAQYLSGAQNSSLPPMLGKGCAWRIFFHSFPPQSGIKSWHLMIMN